MVLRLIVAAALSVALLNSCGKSDASNPPFIVTQSGPNGKTCYIIMQGSEARGGNCE